MCQPKATYLGIFLCLLHALSFALPSHAQADEEHSKDKNPPNILLVLLDDVGFMDFGAYGSDTSTPNIDKIGQSGVMLTRYYTSPLCGPSRASLMTGQNNHTVGAGTLAEVLTDEMRALPAYSMKWQENQATIASRLKSEGYQTFVTGKWGIGDIGQNLPHRFGFDRSWVLDATGSSNYQAKSYLPLYKEVKWFEDGARVSPPDDFYSSRDIVDKMITYIDEASPEKPFFSYLSFMAVHIPVQVPTEFRDKYNGVFDDGWDKMRKERLQRAIKLGLVPASTQLSEGAYNKREWESLSDEEKAYWARAMQVNAGMLEAADFHLGRLLTFLEERNQLQNTIVIVTSDNGPEYNTIGKTSAPAMRAFENLWMNIEGWNTDYETLGERNSMTAIGHEWASVSAAPFHLFKFSASEGGVRVPLVISGPGIKNRGFVDSRSQVADIKPTLLDMVGANYDEQAYYGRSLLPVLTGEANEVYGEQDAFAIEVSGTAALYRGNWKITRTAAPFGEGQWQLYDLSKDPGETKNLADIYPELFQSMLSEYQAYEQDAGVYQLAPGESARKQLTINALKKTAVNYWYLTLIAILLIMTLVFSIFYITKILLNRVAHGDNTGKPGA